MVIVAFSHLSDAFVADLPQLCTLAITVQSCEATIHHVLDLLPMDLLETVDGTDSGLSDMTCIPAQEDGCVVCIAAAPLANVTLPSVR